MGSKKWQQKFDESPSRSLWRNSELPLPKLSRAIKLALVVKGLSQAERKVGQEEDTKGNNADTKMEMTATSHSRHTKTASRFSEIDRNGRLLYLGKQRCACARGTSSRELFLYAGETNWPYYQTKRQHWVLSCLPGVSPLIKVIWIKYISTLL